MHKTLLWSEAQAAIRPARSEIVIVVVVDIACPDQERDDTVI